VNLLVNNAGIPARASFLDGDPERIERVVRTNYLGGVWCLRAFLPGLEAARPSDVVNVVSVAGTVAFPPSGPYSASKHAQLAFSRAVSASLRSRGIRVHTVNPGFVETEGFPQRNVLDSAFFRRTVLDPEDVARHIVELVGGPPRETTIPRWYRWPGALQALAPNVVARLVARRGDMYR
jgi:NAD(P)-dependent dehydrogenase (short-subunit alcohol dehydrogenase family)